MSVDTIKQLREATSCGVIDCKKALEESGGDLEKAKDLLRQRGLEKAIKKGDRAANEGRVEVYIHPGNKVGVLLEVNCETDFVAKSDDFVQFTKDIALHIAAMSPAYVGEEDVSEDTEDRATVVKEQCLLNQPYVKDGSKSIQDLLNEVVAKIGENIRISRFSLYKIGA